MFQRSKSLVLHVKKVIYSFLQAAVSMLITTQFYSKKKQ